MVDKAAIFTDLTQRNAIRREAKLPLLDIREEFRFAVEIATWQEARDRHIAAGDLDRIQNEAIADLRRKHGEGFGHSAGGRWAIGFEVQRRFIAMLAAEGVHRPHQRNEIVYGENARQQ